jgi:hypothetical protein
VANPPKTPLVLGDAFRDAGHVLAQRAPVLLLLAVVLVYPAGALSAWLRLHPLLDNTGWMFGLGNGLINWLIPAAPQSLFMAAVAWTTAETLQDRPAGLGETLRQGLRFTVPVLIAQGLYILGMLGGMVLLIVPGLILALMWVLVTQAVVVDRLGIRDAFGRSRALTKGHLWLLLGLLVVYTLVLVALEWVIFRITAPNTSFVLAVAAPINAYGVVPLIATVLAPFSTVIPTAIYLHLSQGYRASADTTAEVFA